ncbi:MAG: response regulator [Salibacteraceae bacterium]
MRLDFKVATREKVIEETQADYFLSTVLLVDDSRVDNFINVKAINTNQFSKEVHVFKRSKLALNFLNEIIEAKDIENFPEVIFLDLNMPSMNGPEFLEHFERLPKEYIQNVRVVILSNFISEEVSHKLGKKHPRIVRFIEKPLINSNLMELRDNM